MSDVLNRAAHEALGKCWHEWNRPQTVKWCVKCNYHFGVDNPDYCSEDSPRNLVAELEAFTIEQIGQDCYVHHLQMTLFDEGLENRSYNPIEIASRLDVAKEMAYTATAEQRTIACLKALGKMPERTYEH